VSTESHGGQQRRQEQECGWCPGRHRPPLREWCSGGEIATYWPVQVGIFEKSYLRRVRNAI